MAQRPAVHPSRGVYGISVAAELAGVGIQTLRLYEARGLLQPARTNGGTRRYSPDDLDRIHRKYREEIGGCNAERGDTEW